MPIVDDEDPFELVGDLIDGQFRVDAFVGFGDLSVVYRGFHVGVDANVAIKFLDLPTTLDEALVAPLVRSFREGTKLHYRLARGHMHIAQSIGSGQTLAPRTGAVVPYLVREWLEGMSLGHDFNERRARGSSGRSLVETVDLFRGALEGLAYAHRQGVAHLALNPSNLFLALSGPEIRLKILDFGVAHAMNAHAGPIRARKSSPHQPAGLRVLVPAYAAPEQLDAAVGQSGAWTDVYAMALLFVEALCDAPMFGDAPPTLDQAVRPTARKTTLPASLDPRVAAVLERALMFAPRERQASAGAFWKDLSEALPTRAAPMVRRPSTAPKMPALRRAPTLVGLNSTPAPFRAPTTRPPPPMPPHAVASAKPSNRPPPLRPAAPAAPAAPIARPITKPISANYDDAPTRQELAMMQQPLRVPTPIAEPMYVEQIARPPNPLPTEMAIPRPPSLPIFSPKKDFTPGAFSPMGQQDLAADVGMMQPLTGAAAPPYLGAFSPMPSRNAETVAPPGLRPSPKKVGLIAGAVVLAALLLVGVVTVATGGHSDAKTATQTIPTASAAPLLPAVTATTSAALATTTATPTATPIAAPLTTPVSGGALSANPPAVANATSAPITQPAPTSNASVASAPRSARRPFTLNVGRAALDRAGETLADCKRPHGRFGAGQVRVTFFPDTGNVIHVQLGPPYAGSDQGKCIIQKFRAAHVEPFRGRPSAMNYTFIFPR